MTAAEATITTTIFLAATTEDSADPWHVLGTSYHERLATAVLADLAFAGCITIADAGPDESLSAQRVNLVPAAPEDSILVAAFDMLRASAKRLDIDRAIRALADLTPVIEAILIERGQLTASVSKGLLRAKRKVATDPAARTAAQARLRAAGAAGDDANANDRALLVIAWTGLSNHRANRLFGGTVPSVAAASFTPFDPVEATTIGADGRPIGPERAGALTALCTVLAATGDSNDTLR